jgi:hypothetical protein
MMQDVAADAAGQELLKSNTRISIALQVQQTLGARRALRNNAPPAVMEAQSRISSKLLKESLRMKWKAALLFVAVALPSKLLRRPAKTPPRVRGAALETVMTRHILQFHGLPRESPSPMVVLVVAALRSGFQLRS